VLPSYSRRLVKIITLYEPEETGEQFFSPATVERLQKMILTPGKPNRVIQTPVYEYAE
jgi:hypothetical protein